MEKEVQGLQLAGFTEAGEMRQGFVLWGPLSLGFHPGFALNWLCAPEQGSEIPKVLICHRGVEAIILVLPCYLLPCYQHQD